MMHTAPKPTNNKRTPAKDQPRLPRDAATLRRSHAAMHELSQEVRSELERSVREAKSRRLTAGRYVGQLLHYLHRVSAGSRELTELEETPEGLVISADLAIALKHLNRTSLAKATKGWGAALDTLTPFEGQPFPRKPITIGRAKAGRRERNGGEHGKEAKGLQALERQAVVLLDVFNDAVSKFERRPVDKSSTSKRVTKGTGRQLTPPQVAERLGVSPDKVRKWIKSKELHATNVATSGAKRPRWRIKEDDLEEFEHRRQPEKPQPVTRRRKRSGSSGKEYF